MPPQRWLPRRYQFWRHAIVTGTKATIYFVGLLAAVIGGSAVAYWKFADQRPVAIVLGALAVILVLMEAAYRRWNEADREAAGLRDERGRAEISSKHDQRFEELFAGFRHAVETSAECSYGRPQDLKALEAHHSEVVPALRRYDELHQYEHAAPVALQELIVSAATGEGIEEEWRAPLAAAITRAVVKVASEDRLGDDLKLTPEIAQLPPAQLASPEVLSVRLGRSETVWEVSASSDVGSQTKELEACVQRLFIGAKDSKQARAVSTTTNERARYAEEVDELIDRYSLSRPKGVREGCPMCDLERGSVAA